MSITTGVLVDAVTVLALSGAVSVAVVCSLTLLGATEAVEVFGVGAADF